MKLLLVFFLALALDFVWVRYDTALTGREAPSAAFWSMMYAGIAASGTYMVVKNFRYLPALLLGHGIGAFIGVKLRAINER